VIGSGATPHHWANPKQHKIDTRDEKINLNIAEDTQMALINNQEQSRQRKSHKTTEHGF